jgi:RNA polymerase sigma-70 factor, ECF subfamily
MNPPSNQELLDRVRSGDPVALNALVTRWYPIIRGSFYRWSQGRDLDEMTQEVFFVFCRRTPFRELPHIGQLGKWLRTTAWHILRQHLRNSQRGQRPLSEEELDEISSREPEPSEHAELEERAVQLQLFIDSLRDNYRQVLLLHDLHGLPFEEIASQLGANVATVRWWAAQARAELRNRIEATAPDLLAWINQGNRNTGLM